VASYSVAAFAVSLRQALADSTYARRPPEDSKSFSVRSLLMPESGHRDVVSTKVRGALQRPRTIGQTPPLRFENQTRCTRFLHVARIEGCVRHRDPLVRFRFVKDPTLSCGVGMKEKFRLQGINMAPWLRDAGAQHRRACSPQQRRYARAKTCRSAI